MKFLRRTLLFVFCLGALASARAQGPGDSPEQQTRTFYAWYLHGLNAGDEPMLNRKAELKKYVSARFLKEIDRLSKAEGGIEADPFLCAQDWDKAWEKNIAVREVKTDGDRARGRVVFDGPEMHNHVVLVQWVREGGGWKIDRASPKSP